MQRLLLEPSLPSLSCSCPRTLGSLATELFLVDPQHQNKRVFESPKNTCQEATNSMTSNKQKLLLLLKTSCSELISKGGKQCNKTHHCQPYAGDSKEGRNSALAERHF